MLAETSPVPFAACETLCAISRVAAPCSSTAEAIALAISLTLLMVRVMPSIASTEVRVADWIAPTCAEISSVAFDVWLAR